MPVESKWPLGSGVASVFVAVLADDVDVVSVLGCTFSADGMDVASVAKTGPCSAGR